VKLDRRELAATLAPGIALALLALVAGGLVALTLDATERAALAAMLAPRAALLLLIGLVIGAALGALGRIAYQRCVAAPARLAERAGVLLAAGTAAMAEKAGTAALAEKAGTAATRDTAADAGTGADAADVALLDGAASAGSAETRALAAAIEAFAAQRDALRADMAQRVHDASRAIELERRRLAALMAELTQSVVVCNLDGRILLYNNRARLQFRALSEAPLLAGGAELIGLGRSIYAVFDHRLVAHALAHVVERVRDDL